MRCLLAIVTMCCWSKVLAQNLVPNPSFEQYAPCPESPGQIGYATGWQSFRLTPDYFNVCNTNNYFDVPTNALGYQVASDGVAYAGILTYMDPDPFPNTNREFMGAELSEALVPGVPVYVSFKLSPAGWGWYLTQRFRYTSSGVGLFFSTESWYMTTGPMPDWSAAFIPWAPTDTLNWITVSNVFVPDSAYEYVVIGNPYSDSLIDPIVQDPSAAFDGSYVFIDEVCVALEPGVCADATGVAESSDQEFSVWPNPFNTELTVSLPISAPSMIRSRLIDGLGRIISDQLLTNASRSIRIEGSSFSDGPYTLTIEAPEDPNWTPWSMTVVHLTP